MKKIFTLVSLKNYFLYIAVLGLVSCSPGYGYIDKTGKLVVSPRFDYASNFSEGLAGVGIGKKSGYINKKGELVISSVPNEPYPFSNGLAPVRINKQWGHIDRNGKLVISPQFDEAANFPPKLAWLNMSNPIKSNNLVDTQPARFEYVRYLGQIPYFYSGLAAVVQGNRWGYIDTTGKMAIPLLFAQATAFSEELAAVKVGRCWGYINKTGKVVIRPRYHYAHSFSEGLADVQIGNRWGYINKTGQVVIPPNLILFLLRFPKGWQCFNSMTCMDISIKQEKWLFLHDSNRLKAFLRDWRWCK
ncbi:MAG: WG repeat-containing protein [Aphanothece sp. CMT-3BRIN-NPC111]|jgi:hypothetical protein|nr:WG repeat-containing protein [Aphanothece sp. CMT-3BRIN-NPC111]